MEEVIESNIENTNYHDVTQYYTFAKHIRCSSHTLNLVATADIAKCLDANVELKAIHKSFIEKCNIFWKKSNWPKGAEVIKMVLGRAIPVPVVTRWNSLYDALKCLDENRSTLNHLLLCLNVTDKFNEDEFAYLTEYVKIFAPLSSAIDNLQKQRDGFYGHLLPTIYSLLSTIKSQKQF